MDRGALFFAQWRFCSIAFAIPIFQTTKIFYIAKGHIVKTIKTLLFLLTVLGLTACKQVNITAPTNNFVDDEKPAAFTLTFTGGAPTDLKVQLNTSIVTDRFAVTSTGATATGAQLADKVYPGRNVLRVTANKMVKQIYFYYDTEGPSIRILDTDHDAKTVTGYVDDKGGIASVSLDGVAITLDAKNGFSVPFGNQSTHTFVAADSFGHSSTTSFENRDKEFVGISARLNQGGLDFLIKALRGSLENQELTSYLKKDPKLTVSNLNIFGACILCIDFTVSEFKITKFNDTNTVKGISLNVLDNEQIDTNIDASAIKMLLKTHIRVPLLSFNSDANVTLNRLQVKTKLLLDIVDSDLDIDSQGTNINVTGLAIDLLDIPNWFGVDLLSQAISLIANGLIGMFDWMLGDVVDQLLVPIASKFVQDIPINLLLVTLDDGEKLSIRALPWFLDSANKGISVDLGTHIYAPEPNPAVPGALGSLYTPG
ncbi:MAG TPA: hypothetical protein VM553_22495, partial [Dongiaceae bacterium]|nr:hypothetical protein [Dongiaceae bacterium]